MMNIGRLQGKRGYAWDELVFQNRVRVVRLME